MLYQCIRDIHKIVADTMFHACAIIRASCCFYVLMSNAPPVCQVCRSGINSKLRSKKDAQKNK